MALSGTTAFSLDATEIIEEAFERAGYDKQMLTADHMASARRSLNLVFQELGNKNVRGWALEQATITLTQGDADVSLDSDTIDIVSAVLRRDGYDVPMEKMAVEDYNALPDKSIQGRPDRYFLHKTRGQPTLYLYQTPENSTDQIVYWRIRQLQDVTSPTHDLDVPVRWFDCIAAMLAYRLFMKKPLEMRPLNHRDVLKADSVEAWEWASEEDRDRAPARLIPAMSR